MRWFEFLSSRCWLKRSTDKHLVLAVCLINGLRYWSYENLESATEARHNCGQLARRLYHLRLNEVGSRHNLTVRAIDRAAHEFDFIPRFVRSVADHHLQLADFVFDNRKRLRKTRRRR